MRKYYLQMAIMIKIYLMGQILVDKKMDIPIPPIEKGVTEAAEFLTEEIYIYIGDTFSHRANLLT